MNTSLDRNEAAALETGEINTGNFLRTFPKEKRGDQIKTSYKKIKDPDNGNVPPKQDHRVLTFDPVAAHFIRLEATRLTRHGSEGTGYSILINEMEVFGTPHKG